MFSFLLGMVAGIALMVALAAVACVVGGRREESQREAMRLRLGTLERKPD